jgi:NAD(P)-dependent dehydrogenase (short-subunit alcohol dehydrogenase family)
VKLRRLLLVVLADVLLTVGITGVVSPLLFFPRLSYDRARLHSRLQGRCILITGASFGIGACLAVRLANSGARLLLVARTADKLLEVQAQVAANGGRADVFPCDLADPEQVEALLQRLPARIDIVVSNAGKSIRRSLFDSLERPHDFTRTMNVNYHGPVRLLLGLIPGLVARRGHIINVSALNMLLAPMPRWAAYQASKTAFDQWFRSAAPELNARGVSTTSLYLPLVRTRMIAPTKAYRHMPAMEPDEVADLICRAMLSRRRSYAPWWMPAAELASLLLRGPWEALTGWWVSRSKGA